MPVHATVEEGAPTQVAVYQQKTILTHSEILLLQTVYPQLIPPPGIGKVLVFHNCLMVSKLVSSYSNGGGGLPQFAVVFGPTWDASASMIVDASGFLSGSNTSYAGFMPPSINFDGQKITNDIPSEISAFSNAGLFFALVNPQELTNGNAANTFDVTVFYSIVDL